MITFNNQEFEFIENICVADFIRLMQHKQIIDNKSFLITVNNKLISPSSLNQKIVRDGDIIKTRLMPVGG